jgi:hypothetical protein
LAVATKLLFETYTAPGARHQVGIDAWDEAMSWIAHVPLGAPWQSLVSAEVPPPPGAHHVCEIWSQNIKDIYDLKTDFRSGVGLAKRAGKHKKPHERPEVKTLLREYRNAELHKRQPGQTFNNSRNVDNFQVGVKVLQEGLQEAS